MNIKEAKITVENTVRIYSQRNEWGEYVIPRSQKRPVMLIGAPGIGKTDIMKQVAADTGLPLLCYTMTHLTRQSLIGLPALRQVVYDGKPYDVTENTLSDMMAAILRMQELSGKSEGILFLDEVNCVSETLSASMLDLLQNKRIGNHQIPDGWILITAGNPPQYNKAVKEYDLATLDRLRTIQIEPNFSVWKEYAYSAGTHPAVLAFLESNEDLFYKINSTVDGKQYATARGWSDLSVAIYAYERENIPVDEGLVEQYITNREIARKFAVYYALFRKYRMDYSISDILDGTAPETAVSKGRQSSFDERLSVISMFMEAVNVQAKKAMVMHESLQGIVKEFRKIKKNLSGKTSVDSMVRSFSDTTRESMEKAMESNSLDPQKKEIWQTTLSLLDRYLGEIPIGSNEDQFKKLKASYTKDVKALDRLTEKTSTSLKNAFVFIEKAFGEAEMTLFVTNVTASRHTADFITAYGCDEYFKHNANLLVLDVNRQLSKDIEDMVLDAV